MTTARKEELLGKIRELLNESLIDPRLTTVLVSILEEIHTNDDTRPKFCGNCGRLTYFDPISAQHICPYCNKKR